VQAGNPSIVGYRRSLFLSGCGHFAENADFVAECVLDGFQRTHDRAAMLTRPHRAEPRIALLLAIDMPVELAGRFAGGELWEQPTRVCDLSVRLKAGGWQILYDYPAQYSHL
jgi:hypothetical protein